MHNPTRTLLFSVLAQSLLALVFLSSASAQYKYQSQAEHRYKIEVNQNNTVAMEEGKSSSVQSEVKVDALFIVGESAKKEQTPLEIRFQDFNVSLKSQDKTLKGQEFTEQLGEMRMSIVIDPQGKIVQSVIDGGNPQILRTVHLLEDAVVRNFPVFEAGKDLSKGQSWAVEEEGKGEKGGAVSSTVKRTWTVDAVDGDQAMLSLNLKATVKVAVEGEKERVYTISGEGKAKFNTQKGILTTAEIRIQRSSDTPSGEPTLIGETRVKIGLASK